VAQAGADVVEAVQDGAADAADTVQAVVETVEDAVPDASDAGEEGTAAGK
jgi:hypothetical protein